MSMETGPLVGSSLPTTSVNSNLHNDVTTKLARLLTNHTTLTIPPYDATSTSQSANINSVGSTMLSLQLKALSSTSPTLKPTEYLEAVVPAQLKNECPICLENYVSPRLLECLHTICLTCLNDVVEIARSKGIPARCPLCEHPLPLVPVDAFPNNFVARKRPRSFDSEVHLNTKRRISTRDNLCRQCPLHNPTTATHECIDCVVNLCNFHRMNHERSRDTATHSVRLIESDDLQNDGTTKDTSFFCCIHLTSPVHSYCEECQVLVCRTCMNSAEHRGHTAIAPEVAVGGVSAQMRSQVDKVAILNKDVQVAVQKLQSLIDTLNVRQVTLADQVAKTFDQLIGDLEVRRDHILTEIRQMIQTDIKTIELQRDELNLVAERCSTTVAQADELITLSAANDTQAQLQLLQQKDLIFSRVAEQQPASVFLQPLVEDTARFAFPPVSELWTQPVNTVGFVYRVAGSIGERDFLSISAPTTVLGCHGKKRGEFSSPLGLAVALNGNLLVLEFHGNRLQELDVEGNAIAVYGSSGSGPGQFSKPWNIATDKTGRMWISDRSNKRIQVLNKDGQFEFSFPFEDPRGIAVLTNGDIAVANGSENTIHVISADEKNVHLRFKFGGTGNRPGFFQGPRGIFVTATNEILVTDSSNGRIQVFNGYTGEFHRVIGGNGRMLQPVGVCVTADGKHVLAVEYKAHRVSVWPLEGGDRVHEWGKEGTEPGQFRHPWSVEVLRDGRFAVSDTDNNRIQIF